MNSKLNEMSASQIHRLVSQRKASAVEVVKECLAQIDRIDPDVRAWAYLNPEIPLQKAALVDIAVKNNQPVGRLAGVPVGIKDVFNTYDMPASMGSPTWKDFTPGNDARVVSKIRLQDAVMMGKTVTAEFAVHYNDITANPHNTGHSPGTSSSGSAAAVASSMVPAALGTQTAGSTIRPASYCGIYGFKPSFGLLPRTGVLKTTDTLDTIGFFTRYVEDLPLFFDIMRVHGRDYPISDRLLNDETRQSRAGRQWKIALVKGPKWADAEEYARRALLDYAERISKEKDFVIEEVTLDEQFNQAHDIHQVIYDRTLAYYFREESKEVTLVSDMIKEIVRRGNELNLSDYLVALDKQNLLTIKMDQMLTGYDALLTLSTGSEAPLGLTTPDVPDNSLIWTMCHLPAISLPVFTSPNGLPFGAQLVARRYNDPRLLKLLADMQQTGLVHDIEYHMTEAGKSEKADSHNHVA